MFRHKGKTRTDWHNLELATLLSFVAGLVNVVGVMAVSKLTTNVTGYFAYFIEEAFEADYQQAFHTVLYVIFFFTGSFVSNCIVEVTARYKLSYTYSFPVIIEIVLLTLLAFYAPYLIKINNDLVTFSLLFTMGFQNSLVTRVSHSVVRTTHLTGLFTDLGIDVSRLFFYRGKGGLIKVWKSIRLKLTIIFSFFLGGFFSGIVFNQLKVQTLLVGALVLTAALIFDYVKIQILINKRQKKAKTY